MDARGLISVILSAVGVRGDAAEAALVGALESFRNPPAQPPFALDTSTLSKFLRAIKLRAAPETTRQLEDAFMALVAKDNGSLADVLAAVARATRSSELSAILDTAASAASASPSLLLPPEPAAARRQLPRDVSALPGHARLASAPLATASGAAPAVPPPVPAPALQASPAAAAGRGQASVTAAAPAPTAHRSVPRAGGVDVGSAAAAAAAPAAGGASRVVSVLPVPPNLPHAIAGLHATELQQQRFDTARVTPGPLLGSVEPSGAPGDAAVEWALELLLGAVAAHDEDFAASARSSRGSAWRPAASAPPRVPGILHFGDLVLLSVPDRSSSLRCCSVDSAESDLLAPSHNLRVEVSSGASSGDKIGARVWRVLPADGVDRTRSDLCGLPIRNGSTVVLRLADRDGVALAASAGVVTGSQLSLQLAPAAEHRWLVLSPDAAMASATLFEEAGASAARGTLPFLSAYQHVVLLSHSGGSTSGAAYQPLQGARAALLQMQALTRTGSNEAVVEVVSPAPTKPRLGPSGSSLAAQLDVLVAQRKLDDVPLAMAWSFVPVDDSLGQRGAGQLTIADGKKQNDGSSQLFRPHAMVPEWAVCRPLALASRALPPSAVPYRYSRALELLTLKPSSQMTLAGRSNKTGGRSSSSNAEGTTATVRAVAALPSSAQEALLVDAIVLGLHGFPSDLLHVTVSERPNDLAGSPMCGAALSSVSVSVRAQAPPDDSHSSAATLDRPLVALAERLCPLVANGIACSWYIEAFSREGSGLVAQALAAAARTLMREYSVTLLQMELQAAVKAQGPSHGEKRAPPTGLTPVAALAGAANSAAISAAALDSLAPLKLSLQQAWCILQPAAQTLAALESTLCLCDGKAGGALLEALCEALDRSADDNSRSLTMFLLERASEPFLRMTERWSFAGELDDKYREFMVAASSATEAAAGASAASVGGGYVLRPAMTPRFLAEHARAILAAGQHLSVLRSWRNLPADCRAQQQPKAGGRSATGAVLWMPSPGDRDRGRGVGAQLATAAPGSASSVAERGGSLDHHDGSGTELLSGLGAATGVFPAAVRLCFSADPAAYTAILQAAAAYSSRQLLGRFKSGPRASSLASAGLGGVVGLDLFARLASVKNYFLLAQGDYLTHFFDLADAELLKDASAPPPPEHGPGARAPQRRLGHDQASLPKLQSFLELAVRSCAGASSDPYGGGVTAVLAGSSLLALLEAMQAGASPAELRGLRTAAAGLKGYNIFCLDLPVAWPLSLVLSPVAVLKYQLLFRHLFFCRYVERAVCGAWVAHQACKELELRATLALSFTLRQKMLHFLQNLTFYMMVEVVEPSWQTMAAALRLAGSLDDVTGCHASFLDTCLADCLLTTPDVLKLLTKLVTLCLLFSKQIAHAIESHRLSEAELDARAGLNRASERARAEHERGAYHATDRPLDDGGADGASVMTRVGGSRRASSSVAAGKAARAVPKSGGRDHRQLRLAVQTEAMQHTMAQYGWQAMILKSNRMFDALLRDFLAALLTRCARAPAYPTGPGGGGSASQLAHLIARLDFNGFYTQSLGFAGGGSGK